MYTRIDHHQKDQLLLCFSHALYFFTDQLRYVRVKYNIAFMPVLFIKVLLSTLHSLQTSRSKWFTKQSKSSEILDALNMICFESM